MTDLGFGPCSMCDHVGVMTVNGAAFCRDHHGDGVALAARGLAVERGLDPEAAERLAAAMLDDLAPRGRWFAG